MKKTDTLIVGQGIAGTMLAFMLYQQHIPFQIIDPLLHNTSSRIAAGMFTPVSGKRKTIHPLVLQQIPFAINIYKQLELLLASRFLYANNVYQVFNSPEEKADLLSKSATPDFAKYILQDTVVLASLKQPLGACEISHSGWVDCGLMIDRFTQWVKQNDAFIENEFVYSDLNINRHGMEYHGTEFKHIVFCEGYKAVHNPFFKENIIPCKGDILTIKYDGLVTNRIVKKNSIYFIDTGEGIFKAGATYQWGNSNEEPEETGREKLITQLDAMLAHSYTVINHQSAIRPTTLNREVMAKQHPEYKGMYMLNGLGTKGILQAPWWAHQLVANIAMHG
jgi:glycine/D-amino acid oxidase-like deaminating enzyme